MDNELNKKIKASAENVNSDFTSKLDNQSLAYFNTLPKYIQETLMQSNAEFSGRQELEEIARGIAEAKPLE